MQLKELEREKSELELVMRSCEAVEERKSYDKNMMRQVAEYFNDFEKHFEDAPISERKGLRTQVAERIVIDQHPWTVNCYLLKIPKQELSSLSEEFGIAHSQGDFSGECYQPVSNRFPRTDTELF